MEGEFQTYDAQYIHYRIWEPEQTRAVIQILHGLGETAEYYEEFAEDMNHKGVLVCLHEYREHGKTAAVWTEENIMAQNEQDALVFYKLIRQKNPKQPIWLVAHSLGTEIARHAIYRHPYHWDGAIFMGIPPEDYDAALTGSIEREIEANGLHAANVDAALELFGNLNDGFMEESLLAWITGDRGKREYYESLPTTNVCYSNQFYRDFLRYKDLLKEEDIDRSVRKDMPFLLLTGGEDVLSKHGKCAERLGLRLAASGHSRVTQTVYPQARHSILQDFSRKQVTEDIYTWMKSLLLE